MPREPALVVCGGAGDCLAVVSWLCSCGAYIYTRKRRYRWNCCARREDNPVFAVLDFRISGYLYSRHILPCSGF